MAELPDDKLLVLWMQSVDLGFDDHVISGLYPANVRRMTIP
jgi:hypothetical protein